jgi:tRNA/tmRNA/rRNA uracil-C5-methylase (TrmA/RlmC/RlmD family)
MSTMNIPVGSDDGVEGAVFELTVGPVAHGGHCVARVDGHGNRHGAVVFVRHGLPGERVKAVITEEHTGYLRADAIEIIDASMHRVTPPCAYSGRCGGCDFQHASPNYQRELKSAVLREQLVRLGGLDQAQVDRLDPTVRPVPTVPGEPDGLGWRTRVQYTVDSTGRAGLLAHRSHEVVPVERCLIAHPKARGTDVLARTWPAHDAIEVVAGIDDVAVLGRSGTKREAAVVAGPTQVRQQAAGRQWSLSPTAFWQVHPAAADALATTVVRLLAPKPGDHIWDLYGGAGLFAAALAPHAGAAGRITVVEADPAAVAAARQNLCDLATVSVLQSDVARALANPSWRSVDLVVADPPRTGAGTRVVGAIADRRPRAVAYVACDPAAFARDVRSFGQRGYALAHLRVYDIFPNTHHLECVGLLTTAAA